MGSNSKQMDRRRAMKKSRAGIKRKKKVGREGSTKSAKELFAVKEE